MIREDVIKATEIAEKDIQTILQVYHQQTGMIPKSIDFQLIDISDANSTRKYSNFMVVDVHLVATT